MADGKAKPAVRGARKATDKRTVGSALNKRTVKSPDASTYKTPPKIQVSAKKAGRPKKVR